MDATGELLQVAVDLREHVDGAIDLAAYLFGAGRNVRLDGAQLQAERDDPLLRAVVEVAFQCPPCRVGGGDHAGTGSGELGSDLVVDHRSGRQIGEIRDVIDDVVIDPTMCGRHDHRPPHVVVDDDGSSGGSDQAVLAGTAGNGIVTVGIGQRRGGAGGCDMAGDVVATER